MNYEKYYKKAYDKVKNYGSSIIITRQSGDPEYNPETDEYEETTVTITGVALQLNYKQSDIDGTNVKYGDVKFMAVLNGRPETNDSVEFEGKTYVIINPSPLNLNGKTDIYCMIQAR